MAFRKGNKIVTNNLVLALDAANTKSYPGTGDTWKDLSRGNDGVITNNPAFDTDNNGSFSFVSGSEPYPIITVNDSATYNFSSEQTIFMVLKPEESDGVRRNPYNQAYGGFGTITHEIAGGFNYYHGESGTNAHPYQGTPSGFTVLENEIASITVTRDVNDVKWYKNGILKNTKTNNSSSAVNNADKPIIIGDGYTEPWIGKIYLTYAYDRALTADEVLQNHNAINHRYDI